MHSRYTSCDGPCELALEPLQETVSSQQALVALKYIIDIDEILQQVEVYL